MNSAYGSKHEIILHSIWAQHDFCLPAISSMVLRYPDVKFVFDLGCGDGRLLSKIHEAHPELSLVGIDNSPIAVDAARRRLGNSAEVVQGDFTVVGNGFPGGSLLVSSGFTSNLFASENWRDAILNQAFSSSNVVGIISDRFFWSRSICTASGNEFVSDTGNDADLSWESRRYPDFQITVLHDHQSQRSTTVKSYNNDIGFQEASDELEKRGFILRSSRSRGLVPSGDFETSYCLDVIARVSS